ncbi:hypothetical protein HOP50_18g81910 [Chloropicon primus]|uniref:Disease resistance R13L4/SHOC-2-like LRR domain-containing protein n=1 Tax=Chloropicon primus TaxID=1764295 RepID=A0A5B8MYN0_9CHLO|nr:hypothetical protein A3770_18p81670 [Chloropicon primus]UPR04846.1 hypothetical protein HOP50_18g81910 [Chloropicon primus]|mmetsp:Transcript_8712/g.24868  ORF Transcript_8712/g.24868 Transcript_8712/m.24868 type:complete len:558 (-) Transcript_8712:56-1729(-)|eukprot:QDZ25649.1 hypothetical protein A3770_18p81670 [Chloropicon primus]
MSSALELFPDNPYFVYSPEGQKRSKENDDEESEGDYAESVSTVCSEELQRQARRNDDKAGVRKRMRPFGFFRRQGSGRASRQSKQGTTEEEEEARGDGVSVPEATIEDEDQHPATPPRSSQKPLVVGSPGTVVLDVGSPESSFPVQTRTESAEFVNFCADHLEKHKTSKGAMKKKKRTMRVSDVAQEGESQRGKGDLESQGSPPPGERCCGMCRDRKVRVLFAVLATLVLLAVIAVPVALVLTRGSSKSEGEAVAAAAATKQPPAGRPTTPWSSESFGGRLEQDDGASAPGPDSAFKAKADGVAGEAPLEKKSGSQDRVQTDEARDDALPGPASVPLLPEKKSLDGNPAWKQCLADPSECLVLDLHGLDLAGSIPEEVGSLTELRKLDLSGNLLTGGIPESIGNLTFLEQLMMDNNELSGEIPSEIANLVNLFDLRLHNNDLSGTIPEGIGNLTGLEMLSLSRNDLSGEIPASIGQMTSLMGMWLHNNRLTGTIPDDLGALTDLRYFWAYGNQLSGGIPVSITRLAKLVEFKVDVQVLENSTVEVLDFLEQKLKMLN